MRAQTATIEKHPYTKIPHLSIHPCKHAKTMKSMIDRAAESRDPFKVDKYFFYFIKLITAAIPTIDISSSGLDLFEHFVPHRIAVRFFSTKLNLNKDYAPFWHFYSCLYLHFIIMIFLQDWSNKLLCSRLTLR